MRFSPSFYQVECDVNFAPMGRLQSLQILRFLAALAVAETHAWGMLHGAHNVGAAGVDVFFVISGFIVSLTARRSPNGFLRKRLLRVLPMYYLASIPFLVFAFTSGRMQPARLLTSLTLWPAFGRYTLPYLDVGWSLSFEMVFYIALAVIITGVAPELLLAGYGLCWAGALLTHSPALSFLGAPIIVEFLCGVGIGLLVKRREAVGWAAIAVAVGAFAAYAVLGTGGLEDRPIADPLAFQRVALWGAPAALLVFGALQIEHRLNGPLVAALVFLGDASYSLYLSHLLTLSVAHALIPALGLAPMLLIAVTCAAVLYVGVERPLHVWLRNGRHGSAAPAVSGTVD